MEVSINRSGASGVNLHSGLCLEGQSSASELQTNLEEMGSTIGKSSRVVFVNTPSNVLSFVVEIEVKVIFWLTSSRDEWMEMIADRLSREAVNVV